MKLSSAFTWVVAIGVGLALSVRAQSLPGGQVATAAPPPAPASPAEKEMADAVERLGSADPAEREQASNYLWAAGAAAEAALKEAAESEDAEVAGRAAHILRNLRYGIRPDTPRVVTELLNQYRQADGQAVQEAIRGLAARGPAGVGVLTRLWQDETDEGRRRLLAQTLSEHARTAGALLLADRAYDATLRLLEAGAEATGESGERAKRDLAALLLLRGGLDERVAALKPVVADEGGESAARARAARLLVYLCRARGDLTAARWAASRANDPAMLEAMLIETADWKQLSQGAAARQAVDTGVERLGFAAAYHRMAGDAENFEKAIARITELAEKRSDEAWLASESLALNDRPDEAVAMLLKHKQYAEAAELLAPRTQFKELLDLAERARGEKSPELPHVEARAAVVRHFLGDSAAAKQTVERVLKENGKTYDFRVYVALAEAAREMKEPALAEEVALQALTAARPMDDVDSLMEAAGLSPGSRAARWWSVLRQKYREPTLITFGRLKALLKGEMPAAQAEALARAAADDAVRVGASDRNEWVQEIGLTLVAAGHREAARSYFRRLNAAPAAAVPMPVAFVRLGDLEAQDGKWDEAAALYGRAWEMDRSEPLPLMLRAAALGRIGRQKEGRELADLAHLLPLSDEAARHDLMKALEERKLWDEAGRQRHLMIRTAQLRSWYQGDALRRAGDAAYEKGDYLAAASLWDRAFLDNQDRGIRFAEPFANFLMPSLIHQARAKGLMRGGGGELKRAMDEAELAMRYTPGDADALIGLVNELDKLGHKAEADAFYTRHAARLRAQCEQWPASGQMHNQLAWVAAKCKRDLDDALKHARRAVELEPKNTASLDTLAEAHFQRGELQQAIEVMNKCVELEPKEKRHAEQLERFHKAMTGK